MPTRLFFRLALPLLLSCTACGPFFGSSPATLTVTEIVTDVKDALTLADTELKTAGFDSATLTLQTKHTVDVNGKIDVIVVSVQGDISKTDTQTVVLKLVPPPIEKESPAFAADAVRAQQNASLLKPLKEAVIAAASAVNDAKAAGGTRLTPGSVTASIGFDVTKQGQAGLCFKIGGVTIGPTGSITRTTSNQVDLAFNIVK